MSINLESLSEEQKQELLRQVKEDEQKIRQFVADISLKHGEEFI